MLKQVLHPKVFDPGRQTNRDAHKDVLTWDSDQRDGGQTDLSLISGWKQHPSGRKLVNNLTQSRKDYSSQPA